MLPIPSIVVDLVARELGQHAPLRSPELDSRYDRYSHFMDATQVQKILKRMSCTQRSNQLKRVGYQPLRRYSIRDASAEVVMNNRVRR